MWWKIDFSDGILMLVLITLVLLVAAGHVGPSYVGKWSSKIYSLEFRPDGTGSKGSNIPIQWEKGHKCIVFGFDAQKKDKVAEISNDGKWLIVQDKHETFVLSRE